MFHTFRKPKIFFDPEHFYSFQYNNAGKNKKISKNIGKYFKNYGIIAFKIFSEESNIDVAVRIKWYP